MVSKPDCRTEFNKVAFNEAFGFRNSRISRLNLLNKMILISGFVTTALFNENH